MTGFHHGLTLTESASGPRALAAISLAVIGIVGVFFRNYDNVGDTAAILGRLGGLAIAAATIRLCTEAEHET